MTRLKAMRNAQESYERSVKEIEKMSTFSESFKEFKLCNDVGKITKDNQVVLESLREKKKII